MFPLPLTLSPHLASPLLLSFFHFLCLSLPLSPSLFVIFFRHGFRLAGWLAGWRREFANDGDFYLPVVLGGGVFLPVWQLSVRFLRIHHLRLRHQVRLID